MSKLIHSNLDFNEALASGANMSFWTDNFPVDYSNPVTESFYTEVLIVGAGIAGMSVAYELCKRGKKVTVVDDGFIGGGESGRTSAHLVTSLDDRYYKLQKIFGKNGAKLAGESHSKAVDRIEEIVEQEKIHCDFNRINGYLFLENQNEKEQEKILKKEYKASKQSGIVVELVDEIPGMINASKKALKFSNQAEFHILKYLDGLRKAILEMGGTIYTHSRVEKTDKNFVLLSKGYRIGFDKIILCTNAPIDDRACFPVRQYTFRSYVLGCLVKKGSVPHNLYWDNGDTSVNSDISPYHFVRVSSYSNEHDLLISGGEDHPVADLKYTGKEDERYEAIEKWTRKHFNIEKVIYRWSGQIMETIDGLGYIGKGSPREDNLYVITGDTGNGITNAVIGSMIIPDLMDGVKNPWEKIYDPFRYNLLVRGRVAVKETFRNFIKSLKSRITYPTLSDVKQLRPGLGIIIENDSGLFGVTRNQDGKLHYVNGKCTFRDAVLVWNPDEKSWECPLHGCRYTYTGAIINGPTIKPLQHSSINQPIRGIV